MYLNALLLGVERKTIKWVKENLKVEVKVWKYFVFSKSSVGSLAPEKVPKNPQLKIQQASVAFILSFQAGYSIVQASWRQ